MVTTIAPNRIIVEESHHSTRGASSAERWLPCPGTINLTEKLIRDDRINLGSSRPAAEGTAGHLVLSTCLEDGSDAVDMADITIEVHPWVFVVDKEMQEGVQETLDWVRSTIATYRAEGHEVKLYIEKGLSSFTDPDAYGTADIIIHVIGVRLIIVDFKYGKGVSVEPTSTQNAYYGYLGIENYVEDPATLKDIECWIAQPRIPHPDGTIRKHTTEPQELIDWWMRVIIPGIAATRDPDAPLVIGEHCRWCPNRGHCPALKNETFEFPMGIDTGHLTDDELGALLLKLDAIEALKPVLQSEALRRARQGSKIPGRKLVVMRANRVFKDEMPIPDPDNADETIQITITDAILEKFGLEAYAEPKLKSPNQIESLEGGKTFASTWAYSPNKGLTLAAESDKRREVRPTIERLIGPTTTV